jgi:hypothetical protein
VALQVGGGVSNLRQQNVVMSPQGLGPENDSAGEAQHQLQTRDSSSRQRGFYKRSIIESFQLEKDTGRESQGACC